MKDNQFIIPSGNCVQENDAHLKTCQSMTNNKKECLLQNKKMKWTCQWMLVVEKRATKDSEFQFTCNQVNLGLGTCFRAENKEAKNNCLAAHETAREVCEKDVSFGKIGMTMNPDGTPATHSLRRLPLPKGFKAEKFTVQEVFDFSQAECDFIDLESYTCIS